MENQTEKGLEASSFSPPASCATPDPPASPNQEACLHLTGIILAGGRSSRMGEDKALLTIGGVPMLRIVYDVAIALCEKVYVVTPWTERYEHLLSPKCQFIREVPLSDQLEALKRAEGAEGAEEDFNPKSVLESLAGPKPTPPRGVLQVGEKGWSTRSTFRKIQNLKSKSQLPITNSPLVGFAQGLSHVKTEWVLLLACDLPRLRVEVLRQWATLLDSVDSKAIALLTHQDKGWNPLCGFYRRSCQSGLTEYINSGGRSFQGWLAQHSVQVLPLPDTQMLFNCNTPADYEEIRSN